MVLVQKVEPVLLTVAHRTAGVSYSSHSSCKWFSSRSRFTKVNKLWSHLSKWHIKSFKKMLVEKVAKQDHETQTENQIGGNFWPHPGSVPWLALVLGPDCSLWINLLDRISKTWRGKGESSLWVPKPVFGSKQWRRTAPAPLPAPCCRRRLSGWGQLG